MCYDVHAQLKTQLKRAIQDQDDVAIAEIEDKMRQAGITDYFHVSGFAHPKMVIYTNEDPFEPKPAYWGLIPHWVKDFNQAKKIWNNTLNARGETLFEKPSFREAAKHKRCLIYVDGFYEHHHYNKHTIPFHIQNYSEAPIVLAGIWNDWVNKETGEIMNSFSIVTTEGNKVMTKIHNNPKMAGARMPLILPEELTEDWIFNYEEELVKQAIEGLITPLEDGRLKYHTVEKIRGKQALGNVKEAIVEKEYPDLKV